MKMSTYTDEKKMIGAENEFFAVTINNGVEAVEKESFADRSNLKVVLFPESVTKIDDEALSDRGIQIDIGTEKRKIILAYCVKGSYADIWLSNNKNKFIKVYYNIY